MSTMCRCDSFPSIFSHSECVYLGRGGSPGKIARITDPLGRGSTKGWGGHQKPENLPTWRKYVWGSSFPRPPRFSSTMLAGVESSWNLLYESLDWTIFQWLSWPRSGDDFFFYFFLERKRKKGKICWKVFGVLQSFPSNHDVAESRPSKFSFLLGIVELSSLSKDLL